MAVSSPFLDPWDILAELGSILEDINKDFPNVPTIDDLGRVAYAHSEEYSKAFAWKKKIEQCSWKLPTVHEMILRRQKISQGGGCCGMTDLCELLDSIQQLRPATKAKVLNAGWRSDYEEKIHVKLCCLLNIDQQERNKGNNTFPNIIEIPHFLPDGLPDFSYPNYRLPPIVELIRPSNYRVPNPEDRGLGNGAENPVPYFAVNVDGVSKVLGTVNKIGDVFSSSPLKSRRSLLCGEGLLGLIDDLLDLEQNLESLSRDFEVHESCSINIPDLHVSIDLSLPIDECVSQYLPPMFMPKHRLDILVLGGGEEIGIFCNFKLLTSNFGTQFKVDGNQISSLVTSNPFEHVSCVGEIAPVGIDRKGALW